MGQSHGEIAGSRDKDQGQHHCGVQQAVSWTMASRPGTRPIPGYRYKLRLLLFSQVGGGGGGGSVAGAEESVDESMLAIEEGRRLRASTRTLSGPFK